jgi:hypothetical protein
MADQWGFILQQAKPSTLLSRDDRRPRLQVAYIQHAGDDTYLYATDSYALARIPIRFDGSQEERDELLPEISIPREAVEALDEGSGFRIVDGHLELNSREARFPIRPRGEGAPNLHAVVGQAQRALKDRTEVPDRIPLPALLTSLVQAIGAERMKIALEPSVAKRAIFVSALGANPDISPLGLIMPCREP